jgi:hypothetical protein
VYNDRFVERKMKSSTAASAAAAGPSRPVQSPPLMQRPFPRIIQWIVPSMKAEAEVTMDFIVPSAPASIQLSIPPSATLLSAALPLPSAALPLPSAALPLPSAALPLAATDSKLSHHREIHMEWTSCQPLSQWTLFLLGRLKGVRPVPAQSTATPTMSICPIVQLCVNFSHSVGVYGDHKLVMDTANSIVRSINQHKHFAMYQWEGSACNGNGYCGPLTCYHVHPTVFRVTVEQFVPVPLRRTFDIVCSRDHSIGSTEFLHQIDRVMGRNWPCYVVRDVVVLNSWF